MRFLTILLVLLTTSTAAQKVYIIDSLSLKPVQGASLTTKNPDFGSASDMSGEVRLDIFNLKDSIYVKHVSYKTKKILKHDIKDGDLLLSLKTHALYDIKITEPKEINFKNPLTSIKITSAQITDNQKTQTSELLGDLMGVAVQNSQNGGGSPNLRGMEANRLLIIVDGISLNNTISRSGRLQSTAAINPAFIENTEVLFGSSSVAYGNSAMGGAILFNTIKPKKGNKVRFVQQYETSSSANFSSIISNYKLKSSINVSGFAIKSYNNLKMGKNRFHGFESW